VYAGGGYGMLARRYGLASDRLIGIEMVDATGKVITANKTFNADLLWAHRGGGGGKAPILVCPQVSRPG
jgi:FAD/FMN-containing dehydrogenase